MGIETFSPAGERPPLVGRTSELNQLADVLKRRRAALVTLNGERGTGKTSVLMELRDHAVTQGWKVAFEPDQGIKSDTTIEAFADWVRSLLGLTVESIPGQVTSVSDPTTVSQDAGSPRPDVQSDAPAQPSGRQPRPQLSIKDLLLKGEQISIPPSSEPAGEATFDPRPTENRNLDEQDVAPARPRFGRQLRLLHPLVGQLQRLAGSTPVLLLIDGYQPSPTFTSWLTGSFVSDIKAGGAPVVIVVAGQSDYTAGVSLLADEVIPIGKLERRFIKQIFTALGQQIVPPIGADELDGYVKATFERPGILGRLKRVLSLAWPSYP